MVLVVCKAFAGESFSPAPPFPPCAGLSLAVGCAPATAAALRALLVRRRRPTLHRPLRGLRQRAFASLRSTASLLLLAACFGFAEPCSSLTSATRRLPRYCAGQKRSGPGKSCHVVGRGRAAASWAGENSGRNVRGRGRAKTSWAGESYDVVGRENPGGRVWVGERLQPCLVARGVLTSANPMRGSFLRHIRQYLLYLFL